MAEPVCRICSNSRGNKTYTAREMMFGLRTEFPYSECVECGSLQLLDIPDDLSPYYETDYYSMAGRAQPIKDRLRTIRSRQALGKPSIIGRVLERALGKPEWTNWVLPAKLAWDARILDVGCGSGRLLEDMFKAGFTNVTGVDPFTDASRAIGATGRIIKGELGDLAGEKFDFVMMHHSFEHVLDPEETLKLTADLLAPGGLLLIRTPVADSYAWRKYRQNWVQLDAPRHICIQTETSLGLLAQRTGFKIVNAVRDSQAAQIWGSEQYERDIPLEDPRSLLTGPKDAIFTPDEVRQMEVRARELNESGEGDQACFYLARIDD